MIAAFLRDERASVMLEYAIIASAIAAACVGVVTALGTATSNNIEQAVNGFAGIGQSPP